MHDPWIHPETPDDLALPFPFPTGKLAIQITRDELGDVFTRVVGFGGLAELWVRRRVWGQEAWVRTGGGDVDDARGGGEVVR
jgi:hypothetical protein